MNKPNRFQTLNAALESENLVDTFPLGYNIGYGECIRYAKDGIFVTITRFEDGTYERPIHYETRCDNFVILWRNL